MIAYDDLVAALTAWRARQGLPVAQPPASAAAKPPRARTAPGVAQPAPAPAAPVRVRAASPVPRASSEMNDFEDGALVEDPAYEAGGDDYVMQMGDQPGESTAIGAVPEPVGTPRRGKRPDGW